MTQSEFDFINKQKLKVEKDTILRIENLKVTLFQGSKTTNIVEDINLFLAEAKTLALVGESGCGKTITALSILKLLPEPLIKVTGGKILYKGQDLLMLKTKQMRKIRGNKISMIFQEPLTSLNPVFRIGDQVAEVLQVHKGLKKREALSRTVDLLKMVGIPSPEYRIKDYPHQLSGGMRQRVMIAMALACEPDIIIADEPTTALDVTIQAQILELLSFFQKEKRLSLLLITHDLSIVSEIADNVAIMYAGRILEYTDTLTILKEPKSPYTIGLLNSQVRPQKRGQMLTTIKGSVPSIFSLPQGCKFSNRCPNSMDICYKEEPKLKEIKKGHLVRCWLYQ